MKWELRYPGWKTQNHGFDPLRGTCINSPPNWQKSHSLGKAGATSNHKLPVTMKQKLIKRIKTLESWKKGSSAWENRGERCLGRKKERTLTAGPNYRFLLLFPRFFHCMAFLFSISRQFLPSPLRKGRKYQITGALKAKAAEL